MTEIPAELLDLGALYAIARAIFAGLLLGGGLFFIRLASWL